MHVWINKRFISIFLISFIMHISIMFIPLKNTLTTHKNTDSLIKVNITNYKKLNKSIIKSITTPSKEKIDIEHSKYEKNILNPIPQQITSEKTTSDIHEFKINDINAAHIYNFNPQYPAVLKKLKKEGTIILKLLIDENGKLLNIDIIQSTDERFLKSVMDAIKNSQFSPAIINGKPSKSYAILKTSFKLED